MHYLLLYPHLEPSWSSTVLQPHSTSWLLHPTAPRGFPCPNQVYLQPWNTDILVKVTEPEQQHPSANNAFIYQIFKTAPKVSLYALNSVGLPRSASLVRGRCLCCTCCLPVTEQVSINYLPAGTGCAASSHRIQPLLPRKGPFHSKPCSSSVWCSVSAPQPVLQCRVWAQQRQFEMRSWRRCWPSSCRLSPAASSAFSSKLLGRSWLWQSCCKDGRVLRKVKNYTPAATVLTDHCELPCVSLAPCLISRQQRIIGTR